jgi:hypothetical protein
VSLNRAKVFVVVVLLTVLGAGLYLDRAVRQSRAVQVQEAAARAATPALPSLAEEGLPPGDTVVFARQSGSPDGGDGSIGLAPLADRSASRFEEHLRCDRVHMAGGRGLCLATRGRFPVEYVAQIFDQSLTVVGELPLAGTPSRTQVSPGGRFAAATVFVTGHSYADGNFSTQTSIADLVNGTWLVEDLEAFEVRRAGRTIQAVDLNFWGVTFVSDETTFYATLGTAGRAHLVRGNIETRVMDVIADDVECPSLSPDNTRVAFKHRTGGGFGPMVWQIHVLNLQTGVRHATAETRNVDDQAQWLDDDHILYALSGPRPAVMDTWVVPADGSGSPSLFLPSSYSAAVVRP